MAWVYSTQICGTIVIFLESPRIIFIKKNKVEEKKKKKGATDKSEILEPFQKDNIIACNMGAIAMTIDRYYNDGEGKKM